MLTVSAGRVARLVRQRSSPDESGFTLVELMTAMTLSIIILLLMATMVVVYTQAQAGTVNSANSAANVRLALLSLEHDIQSANPVDALSVVSAYNDELQLTIQPSGQVITWQYTPIGGSTGFPADTLVRYVGTNTAGAATVLSAVKDESTPMFNYYDHCSVDLVSQATASGAPPSAVSGAVTGIKATLSVNNVDAAPYGSNTIVHIMNSPPQSNKCG